MNELTKRSVLAATLGLAVLASNSCETTGSGSAYYGYSSYQDPWFYGTYYDDPGFVAGPPGNRPGVPSHPIAGPPMGGPRPMPTMGGGGFGGGGGRGGGRR